MRREARAVDRKMIPSSEERSDILLHSYDSYIYYYIPNNLVAFSSGSSAQWIGAIQRMTVTFENDNNTMLYVLIPIISDARTKEYIFVALGIWWIVLNIGHDQELIIYIPNPQS